MKGLFRTAWIIDVDAHRGDGTAEIMAEHPEIKTLSIHMASGWPLDSPRIQRRRQSESLLVSRRSGYPCGIGGRGRLHPKTY